MNKSQIIRLVIILLAISFPIFPQGKGIISGKVIDSSTKAPLPGANVVIEGSGLGASTDINGAYLVLGVPAGLQQLTVSYIGYDTVADSVEIVDGKTVIKNLSLQVSYIQGDVVEASAQAVGNFEAINQQISANTVKNIVSASKIQELPESNAAEAVGRLPGVALQREGGEGNKIVIRGLSPRYNKVQLEGVSMAATDGGDRSTDLSMISPYMLAGIEVQKAATADQEADQLGGSVNFRLREAPDEPTLNAVLQGGYNDLRSEFKDYKFVVAASKRFFNNKFGLFANIDLERKNRSDNSAFAGYEIQDEYSIANSVGFQDINRINERTGGTFVFDYRLPTTKIKLFSTYHSVDTDTKILRELLNVGSFGGSAREHRYIGIDQETSLSTFTNALRLEQYIGPVKVSAGVSLSRAENETPRDYQLDGVEESAFSSSFNYETPSVLGDLDGFLVDSTRGYLFPTEFTQKALNDTSAIYVDWIYSRRSETVEDEFSTDLNFEFESRVSDFFKFNIKVGGKYKAKEREFNFESNEHAMWWATVDVVREAWAERLAGSQYLEGYISTQNTRFPYAPFIDGSFNNENFLAGNLEINRIPNLDMIREYVGAVPETEEGNAFGLVRNFNSSIPGDYQGNENYLAGYIMPTIELGNRVTLIPGFRYEENETEYGGNRTAALGQWDDPFVYDSVSTTRNNDYFLPMLHAKIKFTDWFDLRTSYTETISRPSYNLIIPTWQILPPRSLTWNNPDLIPIESKNIDLALSFYGNKIGLFTVAYFQKTISNFIYNTTTYITDESQLLETYPSEVRVGGQVFGFINNPNDADLTGIELDWQSNLWFLPGFLSGLVINANYTYTDSELKYPMVSPIFEITPFGGQRIVGSEETPYTAPLIDQPDHLINIVLGYDYKGFSVRGSMRHKSNVFLQDNFFPQLRAFSEPITLFDLSLKQKLPFNGLQIYSNTANLSEAIDTNTNQGSGWFTNREFYGITSEIGLRYDF